jgi:hypothetical protein
VTAPRRPIWALGDLVRQQTTVYRKGEVVTVKDNVTTIDAFPATPDRGVLVDVFFVDVGFTEAVGDGGKDAFVAAIEAAVADGGEFANLTREDLAAGPSYITLGGWLGDQTLALQFMALSKFHGLGEVITPAVVGITDPDEAAKLAGRGFVMATCRLP